MDTRGIAAEYRLSHWAGITREREKSGLSVRAYCESAGFHENTYYYWQKRLRESVCTQLSGQVRPPELTHPGFAQVQLPNSADCTVSPAEMQGCLHINAAGIVMTADSGYPAGKLAALLREVCR